MTYYRVGQANDPQPTDKLYSDESVAIEKAQSMADCDYNRPIAVWKDDRCDIVWLFLCGQQFRGV